MLSAISKRTKVKKCQESETDDGSNSIVLDKHLSAPNRWRNGVKSLKRMKKRCQESETDESGHQYLSAPNR